jgi:sporulation protein YlmC with PRC-barrel domain
MQKYLVTVALALAATVGVLDGASAQVAGSTARSVTLTEVQELALGWSVKKSLLGKAVYNGSGEKVGNVVDLIISPGKAVSYLIIGAGGFIGMGRHDVAIPVAQVQDQGGKLVIEGATPASVKAMPAFEYASDDRRRAQFATQAERDIAMAKTKLAELDKQASAATAEAKVKLDAQMVTLRRDLKTAEAKLADLRKASVAKWRIFEAEVSAAMAELSKSVDASTR